MAGTGKGPHWSGRRLFRLFIRDLWRIVTLDGVKVQGGFWFLSFEIVIFWSNVSLKVHQPLEILITILISCGMKLARLHISRPRS